MSRRQPGNRNWSQGAIAALKKDTPVTQSLRLARSTRTGLWMGPLRTGNGRGVSPEDIRYINEAIEEGGSYSIVLLWAQANQVNDTFAVCMAEAGVLERVETTSGPAMMLLPGLTLDEAKAATRVWVGLQPQLNQDVREACGR